MRALLQRVNQASVVIDNIEVGKIANGYLVYLAIASTDQDSEVEYLVNKILNLRVFSDDQGKFNLSIMDLRGELLIVSQFTLYAECRKGRRPNFSGSADPDIARKYYELFIERIKILSGLKVETGQFGSKMAVHSINDGPVTILIDS